MEQTNLHQKKNNFRRIFKNLSIKSIDGVVILFFVTTGLTSAGASQHILLVTAIPVMVFISLILGVSAYITAKVEKKHFFGLGSSALQEAEDLKERKLLENLGISVEVQILAQEEIDKDRKHWQNLIMQLDDEQIMTDKINSIVNGLVTLLGYIFGGIIPITAYFFTSDTTIALKFTSIFSLTVLFILGYFKSFYLKTPLIGGAMASLFSGALAGIAGYFIAKLFTQAM